jgi:hypothetical protein
LILKTTSGWPAIRQRPRLSLPTIPFPGLEMREFHL